MHVRKVGHFAILLAMIKLQWHCLVLEWTFRLPVGENVIVILYGWSFPHAIYVSLLGLKICALIDSNGPLVLHDIAKQPCCPFNLLGIINPNRF